MSIGVQVCLGPSDIVLDGDPAPHFPLPPLPKKGWGQTAAWIKVKLGTEVGLGPGHIVLDGDPPSPPPKGRSPQFSAHICCGQMARWIKMPLGMEVGLSPGNFVLDGNRAPRFRSPKGVAGPQFSAHVYCGQTAAWIKMKLGMEVGLGPDHMVLDGDPAPPSPKGHNPSFRPMSIVAKRLDGSRWHLAWMWA